MPDFSISDYLAILGGGGISGGGIIGLIRYVRNRKNLAANIRYSNFALPLEKEKHSKLFSKEITEILGEALQEISVASAILNCKIINKSNAPL